jgi:hypothetical protein
MALSWKDLVTTILAAVTIGFSYLMITGYKFPLISGYRWATMVLLILGIGMCALSSATPGASGIYITVASGLGILALILIIAGFIFATKTIFLATVTVIILLWAVATFRHLIGGLTVL